MKELSRRLMDGLDDLAGLDMILCREAGSEPRGDHPARTGERNGRDQRRRTVQTALRVVARWLA